MADMTEFMKNDNFARHNGMELLEVSPGKAKVSMRIRPEHMNSHGTVHGGAIFSLADFAFAAASNSHGVAAVAINGNIYYFKPAMKGRLIAEASEVSLSSRIAAYNVEVKDDEGVTVAVFQGMVYRKKEAVGEPAKA
ncbi:MAG: phenylacetic acid degradation protein PaaD [Verrucomicrobia bacterium]|nr:phenylacetic acid degradation protein PaaD [Verrucomicrobiota bacterium]